MTMRKFPIVVFVAIALAACGGSPAESPAVTQPPATVEPADPADAPLEEATEAPVAIPAKFAALSKRNWQKVVKSPDTYIGKGYRVWACIFQFDAATGDDGFLANTTYAKPGEWYEVGDIAAFTGDAGLLADFVEGDIAVVSGVVLGSYSYDTQAGGNTTVPAFQVVKIARQKGTCR
jgi:hypothetical protein